MSNLNPSRWSLRIWVACFGFLAFMIATYMALYQWRVIDHVWDPVFGNQTQQVLDSQVSRLIHSWIGIPDAFLGALAYLGDVIFALLGSSKRWKTAPWLVLIFGIDILPVGVVSVILVVLQGTVVGSWCFPCFITASISLLLILLAYKEIFASLRHLHDIWKKTGSRRSVWRAFLGK